MSDPRADREAYLGRVAARLRLPDDHAREILEEIGSHLAESVASLVDEGLTTEQAERESIARLGDPGELADGIRVARQTRRRLLVAAGYGVLAAAGGAFWGYLFAAAIVTLSAVLSMVLLSVAVQSIDISTSGWDQSTAILSLPFAAFAAAYAGHRVPGAMARRSMRPTRELAPKVAVVGGLVLAIVTLFVIRLALDPMTVAILITIPLGFAAGALRTGHAGASARVMLRARWIVAVVGVMTGVLLVSGAATLRINPTEPGGLRDPAFERIGPPATEVLGDGWVSVEASGFGSEGAIEIGLQGERVDVLDGWRDLRVEAWPALGPLGRLDPTASEPVLTAPLTARGEGGFDARLDLPVAKDRRWYAAVTTGISPKDGRRYILSGPDGPTPGRLWVGSVWEYLTTP